MRIESGGGREGEREEAREKREREVKEDTGGIVVCVWRVRACAYTCARVGVERHSVGGGRGGGGGGGGRGGGAARMDAEI